MRQWLAAIALVALVSVLLSPANAQFDDAEFSGCGGFVGLSSALSKYGQLLLRSTARGGRALTHDDVAR